MLWCAQTKLEALETRIGELTRDVGFADEHAQAEEVRIVFCDLDTYADQGY